MRNTHEQVAREKADLIAAYAGDPNIAVMTARELMAAMGGLNNATVCRKAKVAGWKSQRSKHGNQFYYMVPQDELATLINAPKRKVLPRGIAQVDAGLSSMGIFPCSSGFIWDIFNKELGR